MSLDHFKIRASEWLFQQGTSTVLLTALLVFAAYDHVTLEPLRFERIKQMNMEIADKHAASAFTIAQQHDSAIAKILEAQERERDILVSLLQIKLSTMSTLK